MRTTPSPSRSPQGPRCACSAGPSPSEWSMSRRRKAGTTVPRTRASTRRPAAGLLVEALVLGTVVPAFLLRLIDHSLGDGPAEHAHLGPWGDLDGDGVVLIVDVLQGAENPARRHHLVADLQ